MNVLVAIATGILELTGRLGAAVLLAAVFIAYAALGLALTPIVWLALEVGRLPRRLRALARLLRRAPLSYQRLLKTVWRQRPSAER